MFSFGASKLLLQNQDLQEVHRYGRKKNLKAFPNAAAD
jgi:hypothetical protein